MLCTVYKSPKKDQTYLFIKTRDDFSDVPESLLLTFGSPILVSVLNLASREKLGFADISKVQQKLIEQGYYLQLPPPSENLLKTHLAQLKLNDITKG
jgi:hypothetical protein